MINVNASVKVYAPAQSVFEFLVDTSTFQLWHTGIIKLSAPAILKAGDTYETESIIMGKTIKSVNEVTKLVTGRELVLENQESTLSYRMTYLLQAMPGCTMVNCHLSINGESTFMHMAKPVLEFMAHNRIENDLKLARVLIEDKHTPGTAK